MTLRSYRTLGRSGLRVSPFCLGGMTLGDDWGWGADTKTAVNIIDRYRELGGNFIDTANIYTSGHSEKIVGDTIGRHSSLRTNMVIGTKFSANTWPGDPNGGGGGAKSIIQNCEQSLRRLQTDYIDLYWLHQWDWNTPFEETMRTLDQLVTSGKVRYIGVSYAKAWKIAQAQTMAILKGWAPFIGLQVEYSLLERTIEDELAPMALELGLGITPWSPLKGGILTGKYLGASNVADSRLGTSGSINGGVPALGEKETAILSKLMEISERHQTTSAAVALSWVINKPGVASTIIGIRKTSQLESNLAALEVSLSVDEVAALDELSAPVSTFVTKYAAYSKMFQHGGIEVNGFQPAPLPAVQQMVPGKY